MASTFVSGPTAHSSISLQLKQLVTITILFYRASLTVTFSPSWESFALQHGTCWEAAAFGSTSIQLMSTAFTGLMALQWQVS